MTTIAAILPRPMAKIGNRAVMLSPLALASVNQLSVLTQHSLITKLLTIEAPEPCAESQAFTGLILVTLRTRFHNQVSRDAQQQAFSDVSEALDFTRHWAIERLCEYFAGLCGSDLTAGSEDMDDLVEILGHAREVSGEFIEERLVEIGHSSDAGQIDPIMEFLLSWTASLDAIDTIDFIASVFSYLESNAVVESSAVISPVMVDAKHAPSYTTRSPSRETAQRAVEVLSNYQAEVSDDNPELAAEIDRLCGELNASSDGSESRSEADKALDRMQELLDGKEWEPEHLAMIADMIRFTGREVRDID
ncbi:hypothetical protein [Halomonas sp. I5-271120]|uniref:hypothetical protein n=1 Tax=Halomonas sp. I5-271120 TaxID=3061632 RepID=UPI002714C584|nr:hypothetical protein [Halomonas sp. I5-271120]